MEFRLPRGMRDIEDEEYTKIERIRDSFNDTCKVFGFKKLIPSPIEMLSTLEAKSGPGIKDEIYNFKDKKERELGLRFDLTVGTTRYVAGKKDLRRPFRVGTFGDMFRYDEPQKGRYRWFHQWNAEIYYTTGQDDSINYVLELLEFSTFLFNNIGIEKFKIRLGHRKIAETFVNGLLFGELKIPNEKKQQDEVRSVLRLLDKIEKKTKKQILDEAVEIGLERNKAEILIRFGNIKSKDRKEIEEKYISLLIELNLIVNEVSVMPILDYFKGINNIKNIEFDLGLVRGIDYYDGYVFEIVDINNKEIGSIAGGGEYSSLIESFSGPDNLSAVGIAGGVERMMVLIENDKDEKDKLISVIALSGNETEKLINLLRNNNIPTTYRKVHENDIKKGLKFASVNNANIVIIIGEKELSGGKFRVKDMKTGKEELVKKENIINFIKELI